MTVKQVQVRQLDRSVAQLRAMKEVRDTQPPLLAFAPNPAASVPPAHAQDGVGESAAPTHAGVSPGKESVGFR